MQLIAHFVAMQKLGLLKPLYGGFKYIKVKYFYVKEESKKFKKQFFPAMWGNSTPQVSAFLDTILASFLVSGSISYLYYANRIFQLPLALFAIATSIALFPTVAKYIKNKQEAQVKIYMKKAFWFLTFLLSASTIGGIILSYEIVWLLFERGSFNTQDTINSSLVLQMYMIGLLPLGLQKLFLLWLYANERQLHAAKIATFSLLFYIVFALTLIKPMGASGLALAGTISGFVGFVLTIKAFGIKNFLEMIGLKNLIYLIVGSTVLSISLLALKSFISI